MKADGGRVRGHEQTSNFISLGDPFFHNFLGLVFGFRRRKDLVLDYQATNSGEGGMAQAQHALGA
jgi:hypothetical protein